MTWLRNLDYMLTVLSAREYFEKYELPKTEAKYRSVKEHPEKNNHSFYAIIDVEGQSYRVFLKISDYLKVKVTISTKISCDEEKNKKALSAMNKALPDGITAIQSGESLRLSQTIWDKPDSCDEDDLCSRIGSLLVTSAGCMKCLNCDNPELLTEETFTASIVEAKIEFKKENLEGDTIEMLLDDDDIEEDTLTLPIDTASISIVNKDSNTDEETGIMTEPPDFDSFVKRLRMKNSLLEQRNEEKGKSKGSSDNGWLDSTCFTPKEKEILTFFKIKMEQRKEK